MACPADRSTPRPADQRLPLRLPARLSAAVAQLPPEPAPDTTTAAPEAAPDLPAALVVSSNGVDPVDLAVEFTRVVPVSREHDHVWATVLAESRPGRQQHRLLG